MFDKERGNPWLGFSVILRPFPNNLFPEGPELGIIGMEIERPPHRTEQQAAPIGHVHHHAAVVLALFRAVAVDRAAEKISVRAEKAAGRRVPFRKREIRKDRALVLIHFCLEGRAGRDRFTCESEWAGLVLDYNIIAKKHAARTALPAGKHHGFHVLSARDDKKEEGTYPYVIRNSARCARRFMVS